jgi:hypothetical protein
VWNPEQRHNIASDNPRIVKRMFDLVLADTQGGPILPNWERSDFEIERDKQVLATIMEGK